MYPGVESLSGNVKMGLQMKMKRGELVGFNGCFGYDYHQDTKTITVNETEAETVRLIYDMYLQGIGSGTIAKRLVELGIKNKRGTVEWHDHGVMHYALCIVYVWEIKSPLYTKAKLFLLFIVTFIIIKSAWLCVCILLCTKFGEWTCSRLF